MLNQRRKYLLRWRYDYPNKIICGMWSNPGEHPSNKAWCQNKEGLIRASIEGKDILTKKILVLAECDGHDFRNFQWIAAARVPAMSVKGDYTPLTQLVGMKLLTTDRELSVFDTGQTQDNALKNGEKELNFATYGK